MYTHDNWLKRLAIGAVGGVAGTLAIHAFRTASQQWLPSTVPPIRQDPGEFMVETGKEALPEPVRQHIPPVVATGAAENAILRLGRTYCVEHAGERQILQEARIGIGSLGGHHTHWAS